MKPKRGMLPWLRHALPSTFLRDSEAFALGLAKQAVVLWFWTAPLGWLAVWVLVRGTPQVLRLPLAVVLPALTLGGALAAQTPLERLLLGALWTLYALKGSILLKWSAQRVQEMSPLGLALYLSFWPGMDPAPLERRNVEVTLPGPWFIQGWITMIAGAVSFLSLPLFYKSNWLALVCILTAVHLGYSDVLTALVRWAGFPVHRLFTNPLASRSLRDFWSHRWNRPFVEMNRVLFLPLLEHFVERRAAVMGAFVISGILHELAISLPAARGWGGPLLYFLIQGLGMLLEGKGKRGRLWTWAWIFLPIPLLFHGAFREALITPLLDWLSGLFWLSSPRHCLSAMLWLAGWGHFLVLCASFQVPHRLGWYEELPRLRPLNRKLLWVYGGFIVGMITSFGVLLLRLHPLILARETGALHLVGFAAVFWTARLVVDAIVFEHSDWPEGPEMVVGHTMLTSLFIFLAGTCWLCLWF